MSLYVDTSALLKRYLEEPESVDCDRILCGDAAWLTARHTWIEVLRNLARLVSGREQRRLEGAFRDDWSRFAIIELDVVTCELAAEIAMAHGVRTLDALHLAAASRAGGNALPFLTYDVRQARAARSLGFPVLGA